MKSNSLLHLVAGLMVVVVPAAEGGAPMDKNTKIQNAMSSAPASIADKATIADWPAAEGGVMPVLRQGTNGWTCLPDMPQTPGNDPMCLDAPWMAWADAWMSKSEPKITRMGFGYMLQENGPDSNSDPFASGPTSDNEWMDKGMPHLMILVPDNAALQGLPSDPQQGGFQLFERVRTRGHLHHEPVF